MKTSSGCTYARTSTNTSKLYTVGGEGLPLQLCRVLLLLVYVEPNDGCIKPKPWQLNDKRIEKKLAVTDYFFGKQ
jgi:hypothetical protein